MRITSNDAFQELKLKEQRNEALCLGCFKSIKVHDVIKVISENSEVPEAEVGDLGAVVIVHNNGETFEVECAQENGHTKWLGTFIKEQIKWVQSPTS
ncbi:hypothetical protein [Ectopseudomonas composti]|uniref:hypothetical protein n=1 Tax=Ectopseudomonas composti TaxID=658457 RepID=UPI0018D2682B|nr:hypothetical protein [Pseudomonas composti]